MSNWQDMLNGRSTTFNWSDKEVPKELIEEIMNDLHNHIPSKQAMLPYTITIMNWDDPLLRENIFTWTHRDSDRGVDTDWGNPQTLAPWLFAFTPRYPHDDEESDQFHGSINDDFFHKMSHLEIGIASSFIVWSAASRGLSTGYCGCLNSLEGYKDNISAVLQDNIEDPDPVTVLLGVGYAGDPSVTTYMDPRTNQPKDLPTNDHANLRRPDQSKYIKWK
jgi:hypothetical protein